MPGVATKLSSKATVLMHPCMNQVKELEEAVALRERKWDSLAEDSACFHYLLKHSEICRNYDADSASSVAGLWKKTGQDETRGTYK